MKLGKDLIVSIDGTTIAATKSCKFSISQNFLTVCSPDSGRAKGKVPTDYDWGISVDCLIPSSSLPKSLSGMLLKGTKVLLTFTDGSNQNRAGWAYVKQCDQNGSVGSLATFSASFEGTGELYNYEIKRTEEFNEGQGVIMSISDGDVILSSDRYNIYGVQISGADKVILIVDDDIVAITNAPFNAAMKSEIYNEDPQIINANLIYADTTEQFTVVDLDISKIYTVLTNYSPYRMILLRRIT